MPRKSWRRFDRILHLENSNPRSAKPLTINQSRTFMAISVGTKAPDFTLKSKQASGLVDVKLSNNFGRKNTVLLFFPAAFTGVCTTELCDVTAGLSAYSSLNADVIA